MRTARLSFPKGNRLLARSMYHVTPLSSWHRIRRTGLTPKPLPSTVQEATGLTQGTYLDTSLDASYAWATQLALAYIPDDFEGTFRMKFAILEVEVPEGAIYVDDPSVTDIGQGASAFVTDQYIPPKHIRLVSIEEAVWG